MTNAEWKQCLCGFLDDVERELRSDTPIEDRNALGAMRRRIRAKRITRPRKPYENEVDALVESRAHLREAAHRHMGKVVPAAIERATSALLRAVDILKGTSKKIPIKHG
jgi:hypothetical protein